MTKTARLAILRASWHRLSLGAGLIASGAAPHFTQDRRSEVSTTIGSYTSRARTEDSILDEGVELDSLSRVEQTLETSPTGWHHEGEATLTRAERARLAREIAAMQAQRALVISFKAAVAAVPLALPA